MSNIKYLEDPSRGLVAETRPLQVKLAQYIEQVLALPTREPHMVEAGTGIGKSYAYLVNAIDVCKKENPENSKRYRIVVSTAMKSLQQQLYQKDLPRLSSILGGGFKFARQVGKANHACRRKVSLAVLAPSEAKIYERFFESTPHWIWDEAPAGLELPRNYRAHSVGYCGKNACPFAENCAKTGYLAAKSAAEEANIVVVNHALLGADIRIKRQHGVDFLGETDVVIVDEAHKLPEALRSSLATEMSKKYFERAGTQFEGHIATAENYCVSAGDKRALSTLPRELPLLRELEVDYHAMFAEVSQTGDFGPNADMFAASCRKSLQGLTRSIGFGRKELKAFLHGGELGEAGEALPISLGLKGNDAAMQTLFFMNEFGEKISQYANAIDMAVKEKLRYAVACDNSGFEPKISVIPIHIHEALNAHLEERNAKALYLSATLALGGEFTHFGAEIGANPRNAFLAGTPFNYAKQAYGYYPSSLPDPTRVDRSIWAEHVAQECYELLMANHGHAFILCTSFMDMNAIAAGLRERKYPYPVLVQNDELKARAREIFLGTQNPTLLGTKSFWEGIDIPGLHLSLVIVPKLPFPNPSDPVIAAKSKLAEDQWFSQVSLPSMLVDLKQMVGRLIRSTSDLGVIAVLDPRIQTKNYGLRVQQAIGLPKYGTSLAAAVKALGQIRAAHEGRLSATTS